MNGLPPTTGRVTAIDLQDSPESIALQIWSVIDPAAQTSIASMPTAQARMIFWSALLHAAMKAVAADQGSIHSMSLALHLAQCTGVHEAGARMPVRAGQNGHQVH